MRVGLNISFFILLAAAILMLFVQIKILYLIIGLFGSAVFVGWILYDTSHILQRADDPDYSAPHAAFDLFMDIIGLFSYVRLLFSYFSSDDD